MKCGDGVSQKAIGDQRSWGGSLLFAVGTFVVLGLEQGSSDALITEGASAAGNHDGVFEDSFADRADQILGDLSLLLDEIVFDRLLVLRADCVSQRARDARHLLAFRSHFVMEVLARDVQRTVLDPMPRLLTSVTAVVRRHLAQLR